jgi:hypothetical protein
MNDTEAAAVFGSVASARVKPGSILFITLGSRGVCVIQGDYGTRIPAVLAQELDPTGAGDTFCGATLAYLLRKQHPVMAARRAVTLAAEMITQLGPAALLSEEPPPDPPLDPRVQLNEGQVRRVGQKISALTDMIPFSFVSPQLPPVDDPRVLDYFFAATVQQFSFWAEKDERYHRPLIAKMGGIELKGSDYLWEAFRRRLELDGDFCSPERQAHLSREELLEVFRADDGADAMPALDLHLEQARSYGRDMLALQLTPESILLEALASTEPLQTFLLLLDQIGGYKEDPLRKKSNLLALILNLRPEKFLPLRDDEQLAPIIDYHLMRSCLRVGLIDVVDEELKHKLSARQIVSPAEEWAVRHLAYDAIEQVTALSGVKADLVDEFFFNARTRCPEMNEPACRSCLIDAVCAHQREMFQPVLRTTLY